MSRLILWISYAPKDAVHLSARRSRRSQWFAPMSTRREAKGAALALRVLLITHILRYRNFT